MYDIILSHILHTFIFGNYNSRIKIQVLLLQGDYGVTVIMFIICTTLNAMEMKATSLSVLMANKIHRTAAIVA